MWKQQLLTATERERNRDDERERECKDSAFDPFVCIHNKSWSAYLIS